MFQKILEKLVLFMHVFILNVAHFSTLIKKGVENERYK